MNQIKKRTESGMDVLEAWIFYMAGNGMEYNHSRHKPTIYFISVHPGETVASVK